MTETIIFVLPAPTPLIVSLFPLRLQVAIFVSADFAFGVASLVIVAVTSVEPLAFSDSLVEERIMLAASLPTVITLELDVIVLLVEGSVHVAVTVAEPLPMAVTVPLLTVATLVLLDVHAMPEISAFEGDAEPVNVDVSPTFKVAVVGVIEIAVSGTVESLRSISVPTS